jgi:hypothetical protein
MLQISIEIVHIHLAEATSVATCEILVKLNDADNTILKVVDVITFDQDLKIKAIRAYKG